MDPLSGLRTVIGDPDTGWADAGEQPRPDPLGGGRGEPDLFAASPGAGALEVADHPRALGEQEPGELAATLDGWRERMRAHAGAAYVHLLGRRPARRTCTRCPSCPPGWRASASASPPTASARRAATSRPTCSRRRCATASAWCPSAPARWRCARSPPWPRSTCSCCRAPSGARFEDDGPTGADTLHDVLRRLARPGRGRAPDLGAHRSAGRHGVLLADRRRPGRGAGGRPDGRRGREPDGAGAGGRGGQAARRLRRIH